MYYSGWINLCNQHSRRLVTRPNKMSLRRHLAGHLTEHFRPLGEAWLLSFKICPFPRACPSDTRKENEKKKKISGRLKGLEGCIHGLYWLSIDCPLGGRTQWQRHSKSSKTEECPQPLLCVYKFWDFLKIFYYPEHMTQCIFYHPPICKI